MQLDAEAGVGAGRAVFLDRDGVITTLVERANGWGPPWQLEQLRLLPGVEGACRQLRQAGWKLVVVTNQPDVARGALDLEVAVAIQRAVQAALPLDGYYVCWHDDADHCACRKPNPGMLLQAASELDLDLHRCWMVGDRPKDIQAGRAAGCHTLLVGPGPDGEVCDLSEAAARILQRAQEETTYAS